MTNLDTQADTARLIQDPDRQEFFGRRHETILTCAGTPMAAGFRELWMYRDLLWLLIRRDVTIKYKQSAVGIGWAVLQPLILMVVFSLVFGRFAKLPSDGHPYPLFVFCALLPWIYFSRSLSGASDSLVGSANLVTKVYFPRLVLPISKTVSGLVEFGISLVLLAILLGLFRVVPGWHILFLPLFVVIAMLTAFGVGLWMTALNVRYRDVGLLVPFLVQIWMYASPIAYSRELVPMAWRWFYDLNPMVGVVEGFRWAILGGTAPEMAPIFASLFIVSALLVGGLFYFRRTELAFADII